MRLWFFCTFILKTAIKTKTYPHRDTEKRKRPQRDVILNYTPRVLCVSVRNILFRLRALARVSTLQGRVRNKKQELREAPVRYGAERALFARSDTDGILTRAHTCNQWVYARVNAR